MGIEWGKFFDDLVISEDASWEDVGTTLKNRARELISDWLTGDRKALVDAVKAALQDRNLTREEVTGVLALIAIVWKDEKKSELGGELMNGLLDSLRDGELTPDEIALLAGNWIATYWTSDDTLRRLVQSAALGNLDKKKVLDAILEWLGTESGNPDLKQQIERLLKSAKPVNLRSLILISAAYLIHGGILKKAGPTHEAMVDDLVAAIGNIGQLSQSLADAFEALAQGDYAKTARLVLDQLGLDDDKLIAQGLLRVMLREKPEGPIEDFLSGALRRELGSGIDDAKAKALAKTMIGIVTGRVKLIPELDERRYYAKEYRITGEQYDIWVEVRKILYAAKLAIAGGAIVSDDPMAPPNVFAAAAISPKTQLGSLAPEDNWPLLDECIFKFTRATWKNHPKGKEFLTEHWVTRATIKKGQKAEGLLEAIYEALYLT